MLRSQVCARKILLELVVVLESLIVTQLLNLQLHHPPITSHIHLNNLDMPPNHLAPKPTAAAQSSSNSQRNSRPQEDPSALRILLSLRSGRRWKLSLSLKEKKARRQHLKNNESLEKRLRENHGASVSA
jgi:hypothetical protein